MFRKAFSMVELVFVIVMLGILAAVAVPRFAASRDDAVIARGRAEVASIRSAIQIVRSEGLLVGRAAFPTTLSTNDDMLFDGNGTITLLATPIRAGTNPGQWTRNGNIYTFNMRGGNVAFTYNPATGTFNCNTTNSNCSYLTK